MASRSQLGPQATSARVASLSNPLKHGLCQLPFASAPSPQLGQHAQPSLPGLSAQGKYNGTRSRTARQSAAALRDAGETWVPGANPIAASLLARVLCFLLLTASKNHGVLLLPVAENIAKHGAFHLPAPCRLSTGSGFALPFADSIEKNVFCYLPLLQALQKTVFFDILVHRLRENERTSALRVRLVPRRNVANIARPGAGRVSNDAGHSDLDSAPEERRRPRGHEAEHLAAYVMLSRARKLEHLVILRPFSRSLFQQGAPAGPRLLVEKFAANWSQEQVRAAWQRAEMRLPRRQDHSQHTCAACLLAGRNECRKPKDAFGGRADAELMRDGAWLRCDGCRTKGAEQGGATLQPTKRRRKAADVAMRRVRRRRRRLGCNAGSERGRAQACTRLREVLRTWADAGAPSLHTVRGTVRACARLASSLSRAARESGGARTVHMCRMRGDNAAKAEMPARLNAEV